MHRIVLIEPHRERAALLELGFFLHLFQMLLVRHPWWHRLVLDEGGKDEGKQCFHGVTPLPAIVNLGVAPRSSMIGSMLETFSIGEAAARSGVRADTIRFYERVGVLPKPPRTDGGSGGTRRPASRGLCSSATRRGSGFRLKELAAFLGAREKGQPPCRTVRTAGDQLLADIDRQIADLQQARAEMVATLADWDRRLAEPGPAPRPGCWSRLARYPRRMPSVITRSARLMLILVDGACRRRAGPETPSKRRPQATPPTRS